MDQMILAFSNPDLTKLEYPNILSLKCSKISSHMTRQLNSAVLGRFTFIDLFAGIGGMRIPFQELGGKCLFSSEWDRYAQRTYVANFSELPHGDIRHVPAELIPDHDLLLAGFPCQPFSIAGVSKKNSLNRPNGFEDQTQGTLFFDVARILHAKRPKAFLLENVKNLRNHAKGQTYRVIESVLKNDLGYTIFPAVLDARSFVPQHRERLYIVGFREPISSFAFPTPPIRRHTLREILEAEVDDKYTLTDHLWEYLQDYAKKHSALGNGFGFGLASLDGIARTLSARYFKDGSEILIPQKGKNPRRLTPRECARLMGYEDRFKIVVSDTQAYKQFGNSVVVPAVRAIAKRVVECFSLTKSSASAPASSKRSAAD